MHFHGLVRTMFLDFKYFVISIWCFCFRCGREGGGASGTLSNYSLLQLQCTHSKVKFKGNPQCSNVRSFVLVIKNNEAVLVIKWSAAPNREQNDLCAKRRLRSAWASTQSGQSSLSDWLKFRSIATHKAHTDSDQTVRMPRLSWVFAAHTCHFVCFVVLRHKCKMSCDVRDPWYAQYDQCLRCSLASKLLKVNRPVWFWCARKSLKTDHVAT